MIAIADRVGQLKTGLQQKDPAFCGTAPKWIIETVLSNLEKVIAQAPQFENDDIRGFALGAGRFITDQATDCDVLLARLNDLVVPAN